MRQNTGGEMMNPRIPLKPTKGWKNGKKTNIRHESAGACNMKRKEQNR